LVATTRIRKGTTLRSWAGSAVLPRATYQSVQIGRKTHAHDPRCLNLLNHSCDPNVRIDIARRTVVALREITPGEILTYFYPATEWDMARPFRCRCGSKDCIGSVRGARHLSPARLKGRPLSRHIREMKRDQQRAASRS
jgi:SET domain-containing protein